MEPQSSPLLPLRNLPAAAIVPAHGFAGTTSTTHPTGSVTPTSPAPFPSEYLGTTDLSHRAPLGGVDKHGVDKQSEEPPFGGISGLERLPNAPESTTEYLALADDSAENGLSRAYRLAIPTEPHDAEVPAHKELVFDFAALPEHPDNIEALAWTPRLHDGRAHLLVVSDNSFSDKQCTLLHRIALGTSQQETVIHSTDH